MKCGCGDEIELTSVTVDVESTFVLVDAFTNPYKDEPDDDQQVIKQANCQQVCKKKYMPKNVSAFLKCRDDCIAKFPTKDEYRANPYPITARWTESMRNRWEGSCGKSLNFVADPKWEK
jgi:hypothetical protein